MSNMALNWAFSLTVRPATAKFVLVAMADQVDEKGLSYLAVTTLCARTCLDRKTVLKALHVLSSEGHITDTGDRSGKTKSIVVYQLSNPKCGTVKQSQKRDTSESEAVPLFPPSSTVFPSKQSQKRDTDPNRSQNDPNMKKVKTSLPDDFSISVRVRKWAKEKGHNRLEEHFEDFKLKAMAKGYKYADWDAAFMNAVRNDWANIKNTNLQSSSPVLQPGEYY